MKKMKLFFLGICAAFATTASAQVTLTAADATDKAAGWTLSLQTPKNIAGWQMELALPEGVTLSTKELTVGGATFTEFDGVKLPGRYGDKYKAVGTSTENGVFLFFIPVAENYTADDFKIEGTDGEACTITLNVENLEGAAEVMVTNIVASDKDGNSTDLAGADKTFAVNHPKGDVNSNFVVNALDIQETINCAKTGIFSATADVNGDAVVNALDIQEVINIAKQ